MAGGDGTINEAVNGMAHSDVPLGILPAGTANVLANELGIGKHAWNGPPQFSPIRCRSASRWG